jgi:quercetin 2,3-dioxygenase
MKRMDKSEEVAGLVCFLASNAASFIMDSYRVVEQRAVKKEERLNRFLTLVSDKNPDALPLAQDAEFVVSSLESGKKTSYQLGSGYGAYLYVASGSVRLGDQTLSAGDAARITGDPSLEAEAEQDSELAMVVVRVP